MNLYKHKTDASRVVIVACLGALSLWLSSLHLPDSALSPLCASTALVLFITALSHVLRRVLFPQIDLQAYARKALENPMSAALVFAAVVCLIGTLIGVSVGLLR